MNLEYVSVTVNVNIKPRGALSVSLQSPSGLLSKQVFDCYRSLNQVYFRTGFASTSAKAQGRQQ